MGRSRGRSRAGKGASRSGSKGSSGRGSGKSSGQSSGSKSSGSSGRSSGRSASSAGSSGSRSGSSVSSPSVSTVSGPKVSVSTMGVSGSVSNGTVTRTPVTKTGYTTSTGKTMYVKGVDPNSPQGKQIQATLDRQRMVQALNKSKQNMVKAISKAKTANEAIAIRDKFLRANPALTSQGTVRDVTKRVNKALETGFTNLGPSGDPISRTTPRTNLYDSKGNLVGSTTGGSVKGQGSFDFFETPKQSSMFSSSPTSKPIITDTTFGPAQNFLAMPSMAVSKGSDDEFLSDSQKAFGFMPSPSEIKGTDPFSEIGQGALRGSSNIMASFWNIGETVRGTATGTEIKPVGYYKTPITQAELTFFGVAEKGLTGKYQSTEQAKADIQKGLAGAGKTMFDDPLGSLGSSIEAVPYIIGGGISKGIQTGAKVGSTFFKVSKTSKADDFFKQDTAKITKTDYFSGFMRDTKRGLGVGTTKKAKVTKAQFKKDSLNLGRGLGMQGTKKQSTTGFFGKTTPKKLTKKAYDDSTGKNFFTSGKGQQLIQVVKTKQIAKTKQLTKQVQKAKPVTAQSFIKPLKVKTVPKVKSKVKSKQKTKQGFIPMYKTMSKQKTSLTPLKKQTQKVGFMPFKSTRQKTTLIPPVIIPPTTSGSGGGGFGIPRRLRGRRGGGGNYRKKGKQTYYGWNINIKKVGSTHKGPSYVTSKSAKAIDKYLSAKGKKAKKGSAFKINGKDFFG